MTDEELTEKYNKTYRIVTNSIEFKVQTIVTMRILGIFKYKRWKDVYMTDHSLYDLKKKTYITVYTNYTYLVDARTIFKTFSDARQAIEGCIKLDIAEYRKHELERLQWKVIR